MLKRLRKAHPILFCVLAEVVFLASLFVTDLVFTIALVLFRTDFASIDTYLYSTLQEELINIRQAENKTVLFVTHDINEAVFLADRVVLLSPRPSTIQKIYEIPLEQKRGRNDPLLLKIAAEIAKDINSGGQDIPNNYWGNL